MENILRLPIAPPLRPQGTPLPTFEEFWVNAYNNIITPETAEEDICTICYLAWAEDRAKPGLRTPCGHEFHKQCLSTWMNTTFDNRTACPACRTALIRPPPTPVDALARQFHERAMHGLLAVSAERNRPRPTPRPLINSSPDGPEWTLLFCIILFLASFPLSLWLIFVDIPHMCECCDIHFYLRSSIQYPFRLMRRFGL